jgi:hypothetical protein
MATKEELLEKNLDDLKEMAKEADLKGRSSMGKEELAEALADGGSSDEAEVEAEAKADDGEDHDAPLGHDSAASDASDQDVVDELSPSGKEAFEEMGDVAAHEADLALDASGPLHLQSPHDRIMTGAVSEEHAKEQEEALADRPEDGAYAGEVTEAGFSEDGSFSHLKSEDEQAVSDPDKTKGELRAAGELKQEDVIDYEAYREDADEADEEFDASAKLAQGAGFGNSDVAGGGEYARPYGQKAVFYTDGLGGAAEQNLERAYEIPELLQSNDPVVREAGDESDSEGKEMSDEDKQEAEEVKEGSRQESDE